MTEYKFTKEQLEGLLKRQIGICSYNANLNEIADGLMSYITTAHFPDYSKFKSDSYYTFTGLNCYVNEKGEQTGANSRIASAIDTFKRQ